MKDKDEIIVYQPQSTLRLEVKLQDETVWLTQAQIAELFGTKRPAITKHLNNIYISGELSETDTCSILEHMGNDGKQSYQTLGCNLICRLQSQLQECNLISPMGNPGAPELFTEGIFH